MNVNQMRSGLLAIGIIATLGSVSVLAIELMAASGQPSNSGLPAPILSFFDLESAKQAALADASGALTAGGTARTRAIEDASQSLSHLLAVSPTGSELWVMTARLAATRTNNDQNVADL